MSRSAIASAVNQMWDDAGTDLPTSFEGRASTKPANSPWALLTLLPVSKDESRQTVNVEKFLLQADLYFLQNLGTKALTDMSDLLAAYFPRFRLFKYAGQALRILSCEVGRVRDNTGGWQYQNVSVTFDTVVPKP